MKIAVTNEKEPFGLTVSAGTYSPSYETLSGSIVTFSDAWVGSKIYPNASIVPVQSGSGTPSPDNIRPITGYSSVDVSRCGKNLLSGKLESGSGAGIERTVHDDGSITFSGTTTNVSTYRSANIDVTEGDVLHLSGCPSGGGSSTWRLDVRNSDGTMLGNDKVDTGSGLTFTIPSGTSQIQIGIRFGNGVVTDDIVMKPVLCFNSSLVTKTISLGNTYYGGILNVDSGVLTVDRAMVSIADISWTYVSNYSYMNNYSLADVIARPSSDTTPLEGLLCSAYRPGTAQEAGSGNVNGTIAVDTYGGLRIKDNAYTDANAWKTAMGSQTIVYPLATPTTIQLTEEEITALLGENNVWANSGDVEVTYRKGGM